MRLGGPTHTEYDDPAAWVKAVKDLGFRSAYCPVGPEADEQTVKAYAEAAGAADIVIAEVGAWSNPLSPDDATRDAAIAQNKSCLALADRIGAQCCVNIAGSRGEKWDGPSRADLTDDSFDLIVQTVRGIIDEVKPTRTYYTLEMMPWMHPDTPDGYVALIDAIDREGFAVHLDPVNIVCSPRLYYGNADLLRECFAKLGAHIKSCHAKDILLGQNLTVHLDEVRPGAGALDYGVYLEEMSKLGPDVSLMLEHLPNAQEYELAAEYIRGVAREQGVQL